MPKTIELTFELCINKVSCPGVWLCQDGLVSLIVYALGMSYQTRMRAPIFPLVYRDVFYFRRRFMDNCTLSNIFCLLKDETIYCELIQWTGNCSSDRCTVLAQYLGALNDVLFPPNLCSNDGVDLLMRRSKGFPGILAPKIEITTKVRIDEVYDGCKVPPATANIRPCCHKVDTDTARQKQVCHTPMYHRNRHGHQQRPYSAQSGSCCSIKDSTVRRNDNVSRDMMSDPPSRMILESRFIEPETCHHEPLREKKICPKIKPCTCEICKRYHKLFSNEAPVS